jgi:hypothetical protein
MPTSVISYNWNRDTKESERTDFDGRACAKSSVFGSESSLDLRGCSAPMLPLLFVRRQAGSSIASARSQSRARAAKFLQSLLSSQLFTCRPTSTSTAEIQATVYPSIQSTARQIALLDFSPLSSSSNDSSISTLGTSEAARSDENR